MKLALVTTPNPVLSQPTKPVAKIDARTKQIVKEMRRVLNSCRNPEGVGLAAPQVGLPLSIFLIKPYPHSQIREFLNPKILETAKKQTQPKNTLEGCLSITNTWGQVSRPTWVELEYQDLSGQKIVKKFTGWEAQIVQHEMDHLKGVLFTHHVLQQKHQLYRLENNEQGKEEFVPLEL
jgi:peptide deformylase